MADYLSFDFQPQNSSIMVFELLLATAALLALIYIINKDYKAYLFLGPGGTPSTFTGYLRVKILSLFALRNPRAPAPVPADLRQTGHLSDLPLRREPRPRVAGIAPHRQTEQRVSARLLQLTKARIWDLAKDPANMLVEGTSCFEKHGTGLFSTAPLTSTCAGEVCHVHACDGSMHMTLYPADARLVVERGWGERHPLARGGFFARFVPRHFVMVYAPRNEEELDVVMRIVGAAVWWVSGVCVGRGEERSGKETSDEERKIVHSVRETDGEPAGTKVRERKGKGTTKCFGAGPMTQELGCRDAGW